MAGARLSTQCAQERRHERSDVYDESQDLLHLVILRRANRERQRSIQRSALKQSKPQARLAARPTLHSLLLFPIDHLTHRLVDLCLLPAAACPLPAVFTGIGLRTEEALIHLAAFRSEGDRDNNPSRSGMGMRRASQRFRGGS